MSISDNSSKLIISLLIAVVSILSIPINAQESRAEQAAREAVEAAEAASQIQEKIAICNRTLMYAPEQAKQELLSVLGNQTCEEAISAESLQSS